MFNSIEIRIEQLQAHIDIVMEGGRQVARILAASASQESVKEHDMLHQQCYTWLRGARRSNVESKAAKLGTQKKEKAVNCAINRLLRTKLTRGSAHKKVKALTDTIKDARAQLMAVGLEQRLFNGLG